MTQAALVLLAVMLVPGASQNVPPRITILVSGTPGAEMLRGIELGMMETTQTVTLLGGSATLVRGRAPQGADLAGIVVPAGSAASVPAGVPRIHLASIKGAAGPCAFSVAAPTGSDGLLWHPTLRRYGASELNERFVAKHGTGMTGEAYAGWIAVKILAEAALRAREAADRCATVARLRYDGHKGRPLSFDAVTRVLRQPLYALQDGRAVEKQ